MTDTTIDQWMTPEVKNTPKKARTLELLKEEVIGDIKVVMRRNEKLKYIEVRAISLKGKKLDSGRGFAQYPPTWHNEYCNGPKMANDYFNALIAWFQGGRKGSILPFDYPEDE